MMIAVLTAGLLSAAQEPSIREVEQQFRQLPMEARAEKREIDSSREIAQGWRDLRIVNQNGKRNISSNVER
jgi:hypothetical protein